MTAEPTLSHAAARALYDRIGGCRAIDLSSALDRESWRVMHHAVVSKWAIPSEVLVAARVTEGAP